MAKNKGGRPTKMTESTLKKLEEAYLADATHLQAAQYAGISEPTLHDYRNKHPEFSKRIDDLRGMTCLRAKMNVKQAVEKESEAPGMGVSKSQWYLERRDPDFKPKKETDVNLGAQKSLIDAIIEAKKGRK
jgi:hypothetical protein